MKKVVPFLGYFFFSFWGENKKTNFPLLTVKEPFFMSFFFFVEIVLLFFILFF